MDSTEDIDKPPPTSTEKQNAADTANEQARGSQTPTPAPQRTSGRIRHKPKEWSPSGDEPVAPHIVLPRPEDPRPSSAKSLHSDSSDTLSTDIAITPPAPRVPRQRVIKRFSPSPPPTKKQPQVADRSSSATLTQPKYEYTPPEEIYLSDFKKTFIINGIIPSCIFKLDDDFLKDHEDPRLTSDEDEDYHPDKEDSVVRKSPGMPPVTRAKRDQKRGSSQKKSEDVASPAEKRSTPVADPPSTSKPRLAAGAERSSKSSSRGPQDEFKVPLPSTKRPSALPSPASPSRAGSTVKEESDGTPSGRPTRKAAAFIHQFVAQVQGKTIVQPSTSKDSAADHKQSSSTSESASVEPKESKKRRPSVAKKPPPKQAEVPPVEDEEMKETPVSKRKPKRKLDEPPAEDQKETRGSSPVEPKAKVKREGSEPKEEQSSSSEVTMPVQTTPKPSTPKASKRNSSVRKGIKSEVALPPPETPPAEVKVKPKRGPSAIPKKEESTTDSPKSERKGRVTRLSTSSAKEPEPESSQASSSTASTTPSQDETRSIRRSGRQSAPSAKLLEVRESTAPILRTAFVKLSVKPKPGSALAILNKTTQFRANRSPTPELAYSSPSSATNTPEKKKEDAASEERPGAVEASEDVRVKEEEVAVQKPVEDQDDVIDQKPEGETEEDEKPVVTEEESMEEQEDEANEVLRHSSPAEPDETQLSLSFVQKNEPVFAADTSVMEPAPLSPEPSTSQVKEEEKETKEEPEPHPVSPIKIKGGKGPMLHKPAPKKAPPPKTPAAEPTRRSGRALRPNKLFEDFVALDPVHRPPETQQPETSKKAEVAKKSFAEAKKEAAAKKNEPRKQDKKQKKQEEPEVPIPVEESAAEKTRKLLSEHRPIKVLFKIGGEVSTSRVVGATDEEPSEPTPPPEDEVVDSEELSVVGEEYEDEEVVEAAVTDGTPLAATKKKEKGSGKYPSWWTSYVPSPKPIIENCTRPDGTVEKVGVSVNAIMDKLLLAVCNDGISRNSNKNSRNAKREQLIEMAKLRYQDKKEKEKVQPPIEHLPAKKTSSELHAHTISTRERSKRAGIYKQNEYLLKPVKHQKQIAEDKEAQQRKALDYLSKQFQREAEEDLRHPRKENAYKPKKVVHKPVKRVTFSEFAASRGEKTKEMLLPTVKAPDTFHRELLRDEDENNAVVEAEEVEDDAVDVMDGVEEPLPDPVGLEEDAMSAANHIAALLMRPTNPDGSFDVSDLYMRVQEEPPERRGAYDWAINEIVEFFVTQSSATGETGRTIIHNEAMRHATMLHEAFSRFAQETSVWTHRFLIEYLPLGYLSSYLFLLRYLKFTAGTSFTNLLVKSSANDYHPWPTVTDTVNAYVSAKIQEPDKEELQTTLSDFLPDVIFVMVPPTVSFSSSTKIKDKSHDVLFRWIKAVGDKNSVLLDMDFESKKEGHSIIEAISDMTRFVKDTVQKLSKQHRDKRIVLVGFRISNYLNHRVLTQANGVSALIDLAFPLKTRYGYRGDADDDINLTYAPTLFVLGSDAPDFNPVALAKLRQAMICKTGALIIHHADENLYVDNLVLNKMGVTQRAIYRSILEGIVEFLRLEATKQERVKLIPVDINNIYDLDVESMKAASTGPALKPKPTPEQKAAQREHTAAMKRKRKAEMYPPLPPTAPLPPMPALHAESSGNSLTSARSRFDDIVKAAIINVPVPHGVVKASPLPSPALPRDPPAPMLLDPANISLN